MHKEWDNQVRRISGGLTIYKTAVGQWMHEGNLYRERMIPVRIRVYDEKMMAIAKLTKKFYRQEAVFFFKVSEESYIV